MNTIELLKIQNRHLELLDPKTSISSLIEFNKDLIKELEFTSKNSILFSEAITRILLKNNFYYKGQALGKSWESYHNDEYKCMFRYNNDKLDWDGDSILFCYKDQKIVIKHKDQLTECYINALIEVAKNY